MTSWKPSGSTNNNKPPSLSLGSSLKEKVSEQKGLRNRLGATSPRSPTLALTADSQDPGRGEGVQGMGESLDSREGPAIPGAVPGCSRGETEPEKKGDWPEIIQPAGTRLRLGL